MQRLLLALVPSLAVLAFEGGRDPKWILGKDDVPFARALSQNGYPDLADELCGVIEKTLAPNSAEATATQALRIDLQFETAQREPDLKKREDLLQKIIESKETFAQSHKGTELGDEVAN